MQTNTMPQDKVQEAIDLLKHLDTEEFYLVAVIRKDNKRILTKMGIGSRLISISSSNNAGLVQAKAAISLGFIKSLLKRDTYISEYTRLQVEEILKGSTKPYTYKNKDRK